MIKLIFAFIVLVLGLYYIMMSCKIPVIESFGEDINGRCPNMLIERENNYFLYNSKLAIVPGVNPIRFNNLEEYTEFIEWQRGQGINCPVLQLQYSTDPQNNDVYKIKPNIFENQGGLPNSEGIDVTNPQPLMSSDITNVFDANIDDPPYNQGGDYSFDPQNQYIGLKTPIDKIGFQGDKSPSPMDTNWGGIHVSKKYIETNLNPVSTRFDDQSTSQQSNLDRHSGLNSQFAQQQDFSISTSNNNLNQSMQNQSMQNQTNTINSISSFKNS